MALVVALLLYALLVALLLPRWLDGRPHERYDRRHVYAVDHRGRRLHVPKELLDLYSHVGDTRIQEHTGDPPNPGVLKSWTYALGLPALFAKIITPFRN